MRLKRWTSKKKIYIVKKNGGENMEMVAIKRCDSFKNISFTKKTNIKNKSFENMIKCGEEIKKLLDLNEQDIYNLLKR